MKMGINELTAKVSELRELYRMADELENMIDTIEKAIREHMTAADLDTIAAPIIKSVGNNLTAPGSIQGP
jgi:CHASE3 domain sensor protein